MRLTSVKTIKNLLAKYQVRPLKRMGQNFLISASVLSKIIKSADLTKDDIVLEVGPGIGTLTRELAKRAKKVIAVEKNRVMAQILKETLKGYKNVEIVEGDIRYLNPKRHTLSPNYKVVANIPYYLTSPLIRKFLESRNQPEIMVLTIQKEVAQRICSKPPRMSLLAVAVQFYASPPHQSSKRTSGVGASPKIISYVPKKCFWPRPEVDSAIIKLEVRSRPPLASLAVGGKLEVRSREIFFKIVKAGFSQPRKQLANNLSKYLKKDKNQINQWLLKNKINPEQRAQTLSVEDWINLTSSFDV